MISELLETFVQSFYLEILALLPAVLLLSGLVFTVWVDSYIGAERRRTMLRLLGLVALLILQNFLDYLFSWRSIMVHRVLSSAGFIIRPLILLLYMHVVSPKSRNRWSRALIFVNSVLYTASIFWNICYTIDDNNAFHGYGIPGLHHTCAVVSFILLGYLLFLTFRSFQSTQKGSWIPVFAVIVNVLGFLLDDNVGRTPQPVSFLTITITVSCSLYYSWLSQQFVREHEQAVLAEQRIRIMMHQIQPHFLYNTLSTIQALCDVDPKKAAEITGKFAQYLRQNLDSLEQSGRIPLEKELEHTRIYADIEMTRFPNIRVEEDIQDQAFTLPPLSVQPLVENAIRHGVRIREEGTVKISTRRVPNGHQIVIEDNGKGFDPLTMNETDGSDESHIGIRNARERIEKMCGGTLEIESHIGEGTVVTIFIPARIGGKEHESNLRG